MNRRGTSVAGILLAGTPAVAPYAAFAAADDVLTTEAEMTVLPPLCQPVAEGGKLSFFTTSAAINLYKTNAQSIVIYNKRNNNRESFYGC